MMSITEVLEEQGRTQRWLAARLGIHESLVSKYLRGSRPMPDHLVNSVAQILGVPAERLVSFAVYVPDGTESIPIGATNAA